MNKFVLLLCFLLVVNVSKEETDMYDRAYDLITKLLKGMSTSEKGECANIFENKKEEIMNVIKGLIDDIKAGKKFSDVLVNYGFKLITIEDLVLKCKAFDLFQLFSKFTSKDGIKEIGSTIQNKADEIYELINDVKSARTLADKLVKVGKILSIVFNFSVY